MPFVDNSFTVLSKSWLVLLDSSSQFGHAGSWGCAPATIGSSLLSNVFLPSFIQCIGYSETGPLFAGGGGKELSRFSEPWVKVLCPSTGSTVNSMASTLGLLRVPSAGCCYSVFSVGLVLFTEYHS